LIGIQFPKVQGKTLGMRAIDESRERSIRTGGVLGCQKCLILIELVRCEGKECSRRDEGVEKPMPGVGRERWDFLQDLLSEYNIL
jgi:hypothetical protein